MIKFLVTGANGQLGRRVVDQLLARTTPDRIGVSVRDLAKAKEIESRGVQVRYGDFEDAKSLTKAFEGGTSIFIVSPNVTGEAATRQHRAAIDAAIEVGATRILYTSHMGASAASEFPPMLSHAAAEKYLETTGVPFTSLRNGFYAESGLMMLGEAMKTGEFRLPEDGPVAWTSHDDLAEAAALVLTRGGFEGPTPSLTSRDAIDFEGIAGILSDIARRRIRRIVVPDDQYEETMRSRGVPPERIDIIMGMFRASRKGEFLKTDSALARLIGREPLTMRDVLTARFTRDTRTQEKI